jgi:DNA-binding response OmpR family regulator
MTQSEMDSKKRVLIVDDEADFRLLMRRVFDRAGWRALLAANARDAIGLFEQAAPDLVLLDVSMRGVGGFGLCAHLRRIADRQMPIIFLTGRSDRAAVVYGFSTGGDDYLVKPVSPSRLIGRANALLAVAASQDLASRRDAILKRMEGDRTSDWESAS